MHNRIWAAALMIFTIGGIAIFGIINSTSNTLATGANSQLSSVVNVEDTTLSIYDNTTVYGNSVVACAKDPAGICNTPLTVIVKTADGVTSTYTSASPYSVLDAGARGFINRNKPFSSSITYNDNGIATSITFVQD